MIKRILNIIGPISVLLLVLYFFFGGEEDIFSMVLEFIILCSVINYWNTLFSKSNNERLPWN